MYQREIYRFTEDIPSDAGYYNYYLFTKGKLVYLELNNTRKACILCDENGEDILDDSGERIFLDWNISYRDYPVWEDKLELYKTIEVAEEVEDEYEEDCSSFIPADEFADMILCLPPDAVVYLDVNDIILNKHRATFGKESALVLMEYGVVKLIALTIPEEENTSDTEDIDTLLGSIDDFNSITINFNKDDSGTN